MKKVQFLMILLLLAVVFSSCQKINGKGDVVTEDRSVSGYDAVLLAMDANVYVTNGDTFSLQVLAQENILPYIITKVENDRLVIEVKHHVYLGNHEPIQILVTAPGIKSLSVAGSGDIEEQNDWYGTSLKVSVSGSGDIYLENVYGDLMNADISGSGNIEAAGGDVTDEDLNISGSGNIDLRYVTADHVEATISGSGNMYVQALLFLDATISGSGNIYYLGNPQINVQISGSGIIQKL